jgi:two-component system chemotaxis response regulator CheB
VVVGASAGGVEALRALVHELHGGCPPVLVVLHIGTRSPTVLPGILARSGPLPVALAADGDPLVRGRVLVAPPDNHMLVEGSHVRLVKTARRNGHRPAVDPLFESAAVTAGPRVLGVVLSGTLDDGVQGLAAIHRHGGVTAAQDPAEASFTGMPQAAIDAGVVDHVLPASKVAALIDTLAGPGGDPDTPVVIDPVPDLEGIAPPTDLTVAEHPIAPGEPGGMVSSLTCPACGGALWETERSGVHSFECRTGHKFAPESLLESQSEAVEDALWAAYRSLLEHADLHTRVARRLRSRGLDSAADRRENARDAALRRAEVLRDVLGRDDGALLGSEEGEVPS